MNVPEPKCEHSGAHGPGSKLVSSHKDSHAAKGRMASARVCPREACVADASRWVAVIGPGPVWVDGVRRP